MTHLFYVRLFAIPRTIGHGRLSFLAITLAGYTSYLSTPSLQKILLLFLENDRVKICGTLIWVILLVKFSMFCVSNLVYLLVAK